MNFIIDFESKVPLYYQLKEQIKENILNGFIFFHYFTHGLINPLADYQAKIIMNYPAASYGVSN